LLDVQAPRTTAPVPISSDRRVIPVMDTPHHTGAVMSRAVAGCR